MSRGVPLERVAQVAMTIGLVSAVWAGGAAAAKAGKSVPSFRVAVTPSPVMQGTQAELLAQLVPAKAVPHARVVAVVNLPNGTTKSVTLTAITNQPGLWEGLAPAPVLGSYRVVWRLAGPSGQPAFTRTTHYQVVQETALARSTRIIGFLVIVAAAWFLLRRRR